MQFCKEMKSYRVKTWVFPTLQYPFRVLTGRRTKVVSRHKEMLLWDVCVCTPHTCMCRYVFFNFLFFSGKYNHLSHMDKLILSASPGVSGTDCLFFVSFLLQHIAAFWSTEQHGRFNSNTCSQNNFALQDDALSASLQEHTLTTVIFAVPFFSPRQVVYIIFSRLRCYKANDNI